MYIVRSYIKSTGLNLALGIDVKKSSLLQSCTCTDVTSVTYGYDPFLLKLFLNSLSWQVQGTRIVQDCTHLSEVFNTSSRDRRSRFARVVPAQELANQLSCQGHGCARDELFLLEEGPSMMKQIVSDSLDG